MRIKCDDDLLYAATSRSEFRYYDVHCVARGMGIDLVGRD